MVNDDKNDIECSCQCCNQRSYSRVSIELDWDDTTIPKFKIEDKKEVGNEKL